MDPRTGLGTFFALLSVSTAATAQETTVYGYDVHGRFIASGSAATLSTTCRLDPAGNRLSVACCQAIGPGVMSNGFDPHYYLIVYPDIRLSGRDPFEHWTASGYPEGRNPNRFFDANYYRATYGVPTSVDVLTDYQSGGWQAGRNPSPEFSTTLYLQAYPDVAAAGINPLWHFLAYGYAEERSAFPVT